MVKNTLKYINTVTKQQEVKKNTKHLPLLNPYELHNIRYNCFIDIFFEQIKLVNHVNCKLLIK
jgi:hypothetical protein